MNRLILSWAAAGYGLVLLAGGKAEAALIAYEGFNYSASTVLNGQSGGTGFGAAWGTTPSGVTPAIPNNTSYLTAGTGLNFPSLVTSGNAVSGGTGGQVGRVLAAPLTGSSGAIYASFLLSQTAVNYGNFSLFNGSSEISFGGVYTGSAASTTYGIQSNFSSRPAGSSFYDSGVSLNTTGTAQLLVLRLDYTTTPGSTIVSLFLDPTVGGTLSSPILNLTFSSVLSFDRIRIEGRGTSTLDEIRIGDTFADVAPIPEPSTTALLVLGGTGVFLFLKRRRPAV